MATAPITSEAELDRLLRGLREGGADVLLAIDDLFGLNETSAGRNRLTKGLIKNVGRASSVIPGVEKKAVIDGTRMAMQKLNNPLLRTGLKYAPVVGAGLAAGDVLLGDESIGNKAMDVAAMGLGGAIGSAVPIVGTGLGIAGGKVLSDLTQYLLGGGLTGGN